MKESGKKLSAIKFVRALKTSFPYAIHGTEECLARAVYSTSLWESLESSYKVMVDRLTPDELRARKEIIAVEFPKEIEACKNSGGQRKLSVIDLAKRLKRDFPDEVKGNIEGIKGAIRQHPSYDCPDTKSLLLKQPQRLSAEESRKRAEILDEELTKAIEECQKNGTKISISKFAAKIKKDHREIKTKETSIVDTISKRPLYKQLDAKYKADDAAKTNHKRKRNAAPDDRKKLLKK